MPFRFYAILLGLLLITAGCKSSDTTAPANSNSAATSSPATATSPSTSVASNSTTPKSNVDVCNLLSSDDLKGVQGEAYKEAQRSDRQDGEFIIAQCYYQMPTLVNSVVLNVTSAKSGSTRSPKAFWEETFGKDERKEKAARAKEKDRAQKDKPQERGEEGEEEAAPPDKVNGLGDEAFWIASRVGGALYVLKKDQFFRISVGGPGDAKTKLNKSKTLAQRVLKKF